MLVHLAVANLGVIGNAEIDPAEGLTVITGETGAGKTLLLGGIRQLIGSPGDSGLVGPLADETTIDGLFVSNGTEMGVTRTLPRKGRSRTRIDAAVASAETVERRVGALVEVVGQHDQLTLKRSDHLRRTIDLVLGVDEGAAVQYRDAWLRYQEVKAEVDLLGGDLTTLSRELALARHQASEIEAAGLTPDLDEEIEMKVGRLRNIEEIKENLADVIDLADQVSDLTGEVVARMRKVQVYDPSLHDVGSSAEDLGALAQDLVTQSRRALDSQDGDHGTLEDLEAQLTALGDLKRKYGKTLTEVLAYGDEISSRAEELEQLLADAGTAEERLAKARAGVVSAADTLSRKRSEVAKRMEGLMQRHLLDLGMSRAQVSLQLEPIEPNATGCDRVELLFSSDHRTDPRPVGDVASGGELSRLVLAFRLAARAEQTATLVFDEVDAGIGGETALAMGRKLATLAESAQVLCVTHLPQVAAAGDVHYVVERGGDGVAEARLVEGEERVAVIATMMSGGGTDAGRQAARELIGSIAK